MQEFRDSRLKFGRAQHHFNLLRDWFDQFVKQKPYTFFVDSQPDGIHHAIRAKVHTAVPDDLGLVIGDFANNAKSSLEHLISQVAPPTLTDRERKKIGFPVCDSDATAPGKVGYAERRKVALNGVHTDYLRIVESHQPYKRSKSRPERDALAILQELNNTDKHRSVHMANAVSIIHRIEFLGPRIGSNVGPPGAVIVCITNQGFGPTTDFLNFGGVDFRLVGQGVIAEDGAQIAEIITDTKSEVKMRIQASRTVKFVAPNTPLHRLDVVKTASDILARVEEIIREFEAV